MPRPTRSPSVEYKYMASAPDGVYNAVMHRRHSGRSHKEKNSMGAPIRSAPEVSQPVVMAPR